MDSHGYLDANGKVPLLSDSENKYRKGDQHGSLQPQLSWLGKASLHEKSAGELPISQECSFIQTVFNGRILIEVFDTINLLTFLNYLCSSM